MRFNLTPCLLLLSAMTAQASYLNDFLKNAELSASGGVNWLNTENAHLGFSPTETDLDKVESTSTDGTWKVGIGYALFEDKLKERGYLNRLLLELNIYQASNTIHGDVWVYELPQFNDYTFSAPISSTRVMIDVKPTLVTWKRFSPYLILGVGAAWNKVSYEERALPGINPNTALSLNENIQNQLAWDLGAGLNVEISETVSLTAEYIYAFLGEGKPEEDSENGATLLKAPSFSYQIQSLLFGVSVKY